MANRQSDAALDYMRELGIRPARNPGQFASRLAERLGRRRAAEALDALNRRSAEYARGESADNAGFYEAKNADPETGLAVSGIGEGDVLFLISNSGRNAVIVDAAIEAKKLGVTTVAVTSMNHTTNVSSRHPNGKRLFEVCDYVLDNGGVIGDASVTLEGLSQKIAPTSSVIDATLVNLVIVNTTEKLLEKGVTPPIFTSANTDEGDVTNKSILEEYRQRVPSL